MSNDALPSSWRPTWKYGALVLQLIHPTPPFAVIGDPFWAAHKARDFADVMRTISKRFRALCSPRIRPYLAQIAYERLMPHFVAASILMHEIERIDWLLIEDIAPPGGPLNRACLQEYINRRDIPPQWKLRVADWFSRAQSA